MKKYTVLFYMLSLISVYSIAIAVPEHDSIDLHAMAEKLVPQVETIRKLKFKVELNMGIQDVQNLRKVLLAIFEKELPDEKIKSLTAYLNCFGFVKKNIDLKNILLDLYEEQVIGFYDPHKKNLYLVSRPPVSLTLSHNKELYDHTNTLIPDNVHLMEREMIISHELTHALQDQHYDILKMQENLQQQDDKITALEAVLEGDALLVMLFQSLNSTGMTTSIIDKLSDFMDTFAQNLNIPGMDTFHKAPNYIKKHFMFSYMDGMKFVQFIQRDRGWEALDQVYRHLPQSMEQILHPEKYFTQFDSPEKVMLPEFRFHGSDYRLVRGGTAGELDIRILFQEYCKELRAEEGAAGWGGGVTVMRYTGV